MNIDIGRGFKRLFLVIAVAWSSFFFYLSYVYLDKPAYFRTISYYECDDSRAANRIAMYEAEQKLKNNDNPYTFTSDGSCMGWYNDKTLEQRINDDVQIYFWLALIPVPIYFLLVFIINGFYRK